ncbi:6872_t:CDS:2 [Diversispora eburnea]|uniref:6872_t:CDS:1 n=1 Tax=Diversispora eburnea TaxID=1213867 RepID=A0A9N8YQT4_9GLOM|nr:6872_t:CDS:2 [Diversispora eburnea]
MRINGTNTNSTYNSTNVDFNSTYVNSNSTYVGSNSTNTDYNSTNTDYNSTNTDYNSTYTDYNSTDYNSTYTDYVDYPDNPDYNIDLDKINQDNGLRILNTDLISLRLTAVISFVDIINGAVVIAYSRYKPKDTSTCTFIGWGMSFFPELYLFVTVMIAFNLQVVFLHRKKVSSFSDRWYLPVALIAAIVINLPPLIYNRFGFDVKGFQCLYRDSRSVASEWWKFATFMVPITLAMIYCTLVLAVVVCKLIFEHRKLAEAIQTQSSVTLTAKARRQKILLLKLVSRISLYAAIPLINISGIIVEYSYHIFSGHKNTPKPLHYWAIIGSCLPAFLFDPAIHNAMRKVKKDLIDTYGYEKCDSFTISLNSPPLSPSEDRPILKWFVRTFLDKRQYPMLRNGLSTSVWSDQDEKFSSGSSNSGTFSSQSLGYDYRKGNGIHKHMYDIYSNRNNDKGKKTFMKRLSKVLTPSDDPVQLEITTTTETETVVTSADSSTGSFESEMNLASSCNSTPPLSSYNDRSRLIYEPNSNGGGRGGSFLLPHKLGKNSTINIHLHQYQYPSTASVLGHVEAGASASSSSTSFSRNRLLRQQQRQKEAEIKMNLHKKSDSTSSIASRDSVDNEISAY